MFVRGPALELQVHNESQCLDQVLGIVHLAVCVCLTSNIKDRNLFK